MLTQVYMPASRKPVSWVHRLICQAWSPTVEHMGSAGTAPKEGEAPKKSTGGDHAAEKTRDALDHAASIVSIAALIATGFGVWSANSLTEKLLAALIVVSLSGAIIAGIGAWRDLRRLIFTATFFVACSAFSMALMAVEVGAASPQAASALNSSRSTHATVASGASTAPPSSSSPGPNSPAATAGPSIRHRLVQIPADTY